MGADKIISGSIIKLQSHFVINLQILDSEKEISLARVNYQWKGKITQLPDLIRVSTQSLILTKKEIKNPSLIITRAPIKAQILMDGQLKGKTPEKIKNISLGPHKLVLQLKGYEDFEDYFIAKNGDQVFVEAPMKKLNAPFYKSWWFWTGVSAVVLTSGLLFLNQDETKSDSNLGSIGGKVKIGETN